MTQLFIAFISYLNIISGCILIVTNYSWFYMRYLLFFLIISCGNVKDKEYVENLFSDTYNESEISCMEKECSTHEECSCIGAQVCIPLKSGMDPAIGENTNICTIKNCSIDSDFSCPPGWKCYDIPMGNQLFDDAKTICIIEN